MLELEIKDGMVFFSTTNKELILKAIEFLAKKYPKLEVKKGMQTTSLDLVGDEYNEL
jgi:hypothetical protein